MNALPAKITAFAAAVVMNTLILTTLGYLFTMQAHLV
jgi:hypothetical protein